MAMIEDASWRSLYRTGAIAFLVAGGWYVCLTTALLITIASGRYINSSEVLLQHIVETPWMTRLNAFMAVIVDVSQVTGFVVLTLALRKWERALPIIAVVLISLAMTYDMQDGLLEWAMTHAYAAYPSSSEAVRAAYEVQVELIYQYVYEVATPFMAIMVGLGVGLMSWSMRKSDFPRWVSSLGFIVAAVALVGGITTTFPLLLAVTLWYISVALQLLRLSRAGGSEAHDQGIADNRNQV